MRAALFCVLVSPKARYGKHPPDLRLTLVWGQLTALAAGIGTAVGYTLPTNDDAADVITGNVTTTALIGIIIVLVLLFITYSADGYVTGRMARFSVASASSLYRACET